ncbi:hypothetical protein ACPCKL_12180 [Streptomyces cellulosae]
MHNPLDDGPSDALIRATHRLAEGRQTRLLRRPRTGLGPGARALAGRRSLAAGRRARRAHGPRAHLGHSLPTSPRAQLTVRVRHPRLGVPRTGLGRGLRGRL